MPRIWKKRDARGRFWSRHSIEIGATVRRVHAQWIRYEDFPLLFECVRRTRRVDDQRILWDVDIAGRQLVWEARIVESIPEKRIRWQSSGGALNCGEVRFEARPPGRTRLSVEILYQPRGLVERLGARLGLVDFQLARDLERFRRFMESRPADADELA